MLCMYVCVCIYVCIKIWIYVHLCMHIYIHVGMVSCMYSNMYISMYVIMYVCKSSYLGMTCRRPAHMRVYAFVFAKTHNTNCRLKSILLANHQSKNFYFAFVGGAHLPLLLWFLCPAQNPPLCPSNLSIPSRPYFSFLIFFLFTLLINKSI